ncbi:TIMELESS-interacting protein [Andrena cerasifolii]|uniref:TIMELESS-interacting protein n=1 Tax=Andrena cerasifolii TaxID=2819439 RepID=UPI0040378862
MPTLSNGSDHDDVDDIVAEYENQDSERDKIDVNRDEDADPDYEESTGRRIDPSTSKTHVVRNPLPKLNVQRLKGPKGIQTIEKYFEGFKFHGKGYEKLDLDRVMKRMEHWAHRLFPKLEFDDFVDRLEKLGTKKELMVFVTKYRQDMITAEDDIIIEDNVDAENDKEQDEPIDEFDLLIAEQIEMQKQVVNQSLMSDASTTNDVFDKLLSESNSKNAEPILKSSTPTQLSDEVKERIERNRQQAIQRRKARLAAMQGEAERNKMEGIDSTQLEDNSNLQVPDKSVNFGNKNFEDNSQGADKEL